MSKIQIDFDQIDQLLNKIETIRDEVEFMKNRLDSISGLLHSHDLFNISHKVDNLISEQTHFNDSSLSEQFEILRENTIKLSDNYQAQDEENIKGLNK